MTLTSDQCTGVIELLASRAQATRPGAGETADANEIGLGDHLAQIGKPRSQGTRVAAVAAADGFVQENDLALSPDVTGTVAALQALAERIVAVEIVDGNSWSFALVDPAGTDTHGVLEHITAWERKVRGAKYLYRFRVDDAGQATACRDALSSAKSSNVDGRRFSRVNAGRNESTCLYVGSSTSLSTRVRQHLGLAHRATYALQIAHWTSQVPLTGWLHLDVTRFAPITGGDVLQALEDDLWLRERPRFGKMGAR